MTESRPPAAELPELVAAAARGDQAAWNGLVERFSGLLWGICRSYRLSTADASDVFQLTWLRLLEHVDSIHDPARVPGWLATTCRRECQAHLRRTQRLRPVGPSEFFDLRPAADGGPEQPTMIAERNAGLWRAFARLEERCQSLLRVLVVLPDSGAPSYQAAAEALGMPIGSLGPTRARCLAKLRELLGAEGISGLLADS